MTRIRVSTTVDQQLLDQARALIAAPDSIVIDRALDALLARHREAAIDARYAAYDELPIDTPDEWGDIESFRQALSEARSGTRPPRAGHAA